MTHKTWCFLFFLSYLLFIPVNHTHAADANMVADDILSYLEHQPSAAFDQEKEDKEFKEYLAQRIRNNKNAVALQKSLQQTNQNDSSLLQSIANILYNILK